MWTIVSVQCRSASWSSWTPPVFPCSPLAKRKEKSCFQPNFTCKNDGESNCKKCHSGLHGTISLGKALLSHSRAARGSALALLTSQSCSALTHRLGHITLLQVIACSLLNLLVLCPSATPTFYFPLVPASLHSSTPPFPCSSWIYKLLLHQRLQFWMLSCC